MAHSRHIRTGATVRLLARSRARLFFCNLTDVLVASNPALSQCCAMAWLVHTPLFISWDAPRRRTGSVPHVLRSCPLPVVRICSDDFPDVPTRGPSTRRRSHVGLRNIRLRGASSHSYRTTAFRLHWTEFE